MDLMKKCEVSDQWENEPVNTANISIHVQAEIICENRDKKTCKFEILLNMPLEIGRKILSSGLKTEC